MKCRKIILITFTIFISLLILPNTFNFIYNRILNMIDNSSLIPFYKYDIMLDEKFKEVVQLIDNFIESIKSITFEEIKEYIYTKILTVDNLIYITYFAQISMILYILFDMWVSGENLKFTITISARLFTRFIEYLRKEYNLFKEVFKENFFKLILIFLIFSNVGIFLAMEFLLFMYFYIISVFDYTSHIVLFDLFKFIVINLLNYILTTDIRILALITFIILFILGYFQAWKKLLMNWTLVRKIVSLFGTITIVNGSPGTGKTLTISQFSLAATENMIRDNENVISKFEIAYPYVNFSYINLILKCFFLDLTEDEFNKAIKENNLLLIDIYKNRYILDSEICKSFFNVYYRGTPICSSYAIKDPYYDTFTRRADIQSFRLFKKQDSLFHENDEIITLSEFDKEFNSHDDKKTVGDDGTAAFFSIFSHLSNRTGRVFIDYQDKDQGIRRIRALAHSFIQLEDRKVKMPFIFNIFYKISNKIFNILVDIMERYRTRKIKTEKYWTVRQKQREHKRNDVTLLYVIIRYLSFVFYRIVSYFEKYQYFEIKGKMSHNDSFEDAKDFKYRLNVMDFYHNDSEVYRSCQFNKFYSDLRNSLALDKNIKQSLFQMEKWTSLDPDANEYASLHMRFYSKIVSSQYNDEEQN